MTCTQCLPSCWGELVRRVGTHGPSTQTGREAALAQGQVMSLLYCAFPGCRQDLPAGSAAWPSQLFAVVVAVFGLASFALVLALIEQARGVVTQAGASACAVRVSAAALRCCALCAGCSTGVSTLLLLVCPAFMHPVHKLQRPSFQYFLCCRWCSKCWRATSSVAACATRPGTRWCWPTASRRAASPKSPAS